MFDFLGGKIAKQVFLGAKAKKRKDFLGFSEFRGGSSNSKTFLYLPSNLWCAKIILRCQKMFYNSGEVISDQFNRLNLIQNSENFWN